MRRWAFAVAVGTALMAAGCSSTTSGPGTSTTVPGSTVTTSSSVGGAPTTVPASASAPAQQFLSAADDVDSAYTQWKTAADAATAADQLAGPASSYVTALTSFDDTLRSLAVTGRTATDVHSLMGDDAVVIGDLDTAGAQTASSQAAWVARLRADGATAVVASNAVRSDLGLPAAPTD